MNRAISGQAMVETIIVMFVTLLLLFGIIQFGLLYNAKTVLNYATFEAARAASLNYGSPKAIDYALARSLGSLLSSSGSSQHERYQNSQTKYLDLIDDGDVICVERINPPANSPHWHPDSAAGNDYRNYIPNDHLRYRSAQLKQGMSIQDANLLKIRVTYCHKVIVPFYSRVLQRLMVAREISNDPDPIPDYKAPNLGSFAEQCFLNNRVPIESQAIMRMQTPIRDYTFPTSCQ
jgi:hypothetical protein